MEKLIKELEEKREKAVLMGGKERLERQYELGRLDVRQRIDKLVDSGTFMELGMLAHSELEGMEDRSPADGLVGGLGKINGRPVVIVAMDNTVFAGTESTVSMRKSKMIHEFAIKRKLPIFHLGEGSGLRIPDSMGSDGISSKMMPMYLLNHNKQVPFFTAILGDSFGWSTWMAITSDLVVQAKGTCMAIAGPKMLEVATGEKIGLEELGGWEIHAKQTGQVDLFGENDEDSIETLKELFEFFPLNSSEEPPTRDTEDKPDRILNEVIDLVPTRRNRAYDMNKLIEQIVDDGRFVEVKPLYGRALITGFAHLNGRAVGIIANQPFYYGGASGADEADKATEFICLCDSWNIPMIFLHDIPGFRVGSKAEQEKMPSKVMVWNQALAKSSVPKISVVIRKSIGAAYSNMSGPLMGGDFVFAWPTAEINFTGPEVGLHVVFEKEIQNSDDPSDKREELLNFWKEASSPYKAAGKHLIDDVIDPRDTRKVLINSLDYACSSTGSISKRLLANWPTSF